MPLPTSYTNDERERLLLVLAREIAMDIREIGSILETHKLSAEQFETISKQHRFQELLAGQIQAWQSATNTDARVRLKMLCAVEESIPEMFQRLHEPGGLTPAKVELMKTLMKGAGVGIVEGTGAGADRVTITINMGAEKQMTVQADLPSRVIEGEYAEL